MKKLIFPFAISLLFFVSCKEEALPVDTAKPQYDLEDTTYLNSQVPTPENKVVLFEDFTGASCVNCPKGHDIVKNLLANNPGRIVAVAIHPGMNPLVQARPITGEPDFNTSWGALIKDLVVVGGLPFGSADRVEKANLTSTWEQNFNTRLAVSSPVNLSLVVVSYNTVSRELVYEVKIELTENMTDLLYFSTMITENGIFSKQETPSGIIPYTHDHILRDMPNFSVILNPGLTPGLSAGRVFKKQFKTTLKNDWMPDNCRIVSCVHRSQEVIQAKEIRIK